MMPPCRNAPVRTVHGRDMRVAGRSARSTFVEGSKEVTAYIRTQIAIIA